MSLLRTHGGFTRSISTPTLEFGLAISTRNVRLRFRPLCSALYAYPVREQSEFAPVYTPNAIAVEQARGVSGTSRTLEPHGQRFQSA